MAKKIMVVDDEKYITELLKAILEEKGFDVIPAYSGQECLDKLKSVKPDLILMDIFMPGMSGLETCEKIRKNQKTKKLKIIFLTIAKFSHLTPNELNKIKKIKASDYITKPFDNEDLVERVERVLK